MRQYNNRAKPRTTKSQQLRNKAGQFSTTQKEFAARDIAFEDYKKQMGTQYKNLQDAYAKQGQQFQTELNRVQGQYNQDKQNQIKATQAQQQINKATNKRQKLSSGLSKVANVAGFIKGIVS